jgi:tetratricopeptide (TPR) repeat protein
MLRGRVAEMRHARLHAQARSAGIVYSASRPHRYQIFMLQHRVSRLFLGVCIAAATVGVLVSPSGAEETSKPPATAPAPDGDKRNPVAEAEAVIKFHEKRVAELPTDPTAPIRLASALLDLARITHDYKVYPRAEAACKEALKRDPKHFGAMILQGSAYLGQHRFRDAVEAADAALKVRPDAPEALALRGDALLQLGDLTKTREDYEKVLELQPDLVAHSRMAHLQFAEGDADAAAASFDAALAAGEEKAAAPALLAWCLVRVGEFRFRTGDWDEADKWYKRALELSEDDHDVLDHMAELHAARGEYDEALKLSDRAISLSPRPEFQQSRGDIYAVMKKDAEALKCHEKALAAYLEAAEAGHAHYYHHLAGLLCDSDFVRDPAEAIRWAKKDVQIRLTVNTYDALAWAYYHDGNDRDAEATMEKALRDKTIDSHILYHAGLIYSRSGEAAKGRAYLRRAADANPKFNEFHFHR